MKKRRPFSRRSTRKIAGKEVVAAPHAGDDTGGKVIDLTEALLASLKRKPATAAAVKVPGKPVEAETGAKRKGVKRAAKAEESEQVPVGSRARK